MDSDQYISILKEIAETGKEVSLMVSGCSMNPFLGDKRDMISFTRPDRELRRGDMVFYQRADGQYVMHRICRVKQDGYYITGDAQTEIEGPVQREQIFGLVQKVCRKGRWIGPEDFWWRFFAHVWIRLIPLRPMILKMYKLIFKN
ncbi:MAG: S24/S26 family peptidase [Dorea sp.]|nr:S24/S26 family peptidase [Dorea sp.]